MEQVFYGIAIITYGLFVIRFILSWIGGDFEIDADADLDISDIASFKGLTHFLMGFSGWLSTKSLLTHHVWWYDYIIAIVLGVIFVVILFYVYKLMCTLECKPEILQEKELVGKSGKIYLTLGRSDQGFYLYTVTVANNVGTTEVIGRSEKKFKVGDVVILSDYKDAHYLLI